MKDGTRHNTLIFLDDGKYDLFIFIGLKDKNLWKQSSDKMLIMDNLTYIWDILIEMLCFCV